MPITIQLYGIEELGPEAKAKAIRDHHDINVDEGSEWDDSEKDYWKEKLEEEGFSNADIACSGFWVQGDGASFTCPHIDILRFLKTGDRWKPEYRLIEVAGLHLGFMLNGKIERHDSRYVHENTIDATIEEDVQCDGLLGVRIGNILTDVEKLLQERAREVSREIWKSLEKEYDYYVTDEAIEETLEAREYKFTEEGERVRV